MVKGFANPCGGVYSWKNSKNSKPSDVPSPTEAVDCPDRDGRLYLRAGSWHSRPLDIVQKN